MLALKLVKIKVSILKAALAVRVVVVAESMRKKKFAKLWRVLRKRIC